MLCSAEAFAAQPFTMPAAGELEKNFSRPPDSARPWVYWTWLNANVTPEGITADLEAMRRVGIGGVLLLDVDQGVLEGSVKFMNDAWRELFAHTVREAKRLGMEINLNNGPGYFGSGGAWMPPEMGIQTVVTSETRVHGGQSWSGQLPVAGNHTAYRDVAVIAVAEPDLGTQKRFEIPNFSFKAMTWKGWVNYNGGQSAPLAATAPDGVSIPLEKVVNLTSRMKPDGSLEWDAPPGDWTVMRIGHAWSGSKPGPAVGGSTGPEIDYLNKEAVRFHYNAMVKRIKESVGSAAAGTLVATHVDSWEGGGQNWTAEMPAEFRKRRGYEIETFLPVLAGRVIGNLQLTERFLWDLRQTVSELMVENYVAEFQRMTRESGLRLTFECYTTGGNDLDAANFVDEPMAEFWSPLEANGFKASTKSMSSAAHLNGRVIVGAESFTADHAERWLRHPANLKPLADFAFSQGINRLVIHRYAAQRFLQPAPGLQMGPWGQHYERTNTWWEWSLPWHTYLSRCQYLLRQGKPVADVLDLQAEEQLRRFQQRNLAGYDYTACGPDSFMRMKVRDGRWIAPSGISYRLLVLPDSETMSIARLKHLIEGVRAGAAVFGLPPQATPGLTGYPKADAELKRLTEELWGTGTPVPERKVGDGFVFTGQSPETVLARLGLAPDFSSDRPLIWNHRHMDGADVYFVANGSAGAVQAKATFRVTGKQPELWNPETGAIEAMDAFQINDGTTTVPLQFEPHGSVFVMFRKPAVGSGNAMTELPPSSDKIIVLNARYGVLDDPQKTRDVAVKVQALVDGGNLSFSVGDLAKDDDPAYGMVKTLEVTYSSGGKSFRVSGRDTEFITIEPFQSNEGEIPGSWEVSFDPKWGGPDKVVFEKLEDWSKRPEAGIKYYSGTAVYRKTFPYQASDSKSKIHLDLGKVAVMARVKFNGRDLGILWKPPYRFDITPLVKAGDNELEIQVVNLWPNRLIGDEQLPEDSERNANGTLKQWPQWLLDGQPSPTGRLTFSSWRLWKKDEALQASGLIGPVQIINIK
jgi:hypothetical protein